jgi:hypothetical protein
MQNVVRAIAAFFALAGVTMALAQNVDGPAVGQVIVERGGPTFNGWERVDSTLFQHRSRRDSATIETMECCFAVFKKANRYQLILTAPTAGDGRGGVQAERVIKKWTIVVKSDEQSVDCNMLSIEPVMSFSAGRGKIVRSLVYDGSQIVDVKWFDPGNYCDYGD